MPVSVRSIASSEIVVKYKEPFLTDAINRSHAVVVPRGIYDGFRIGPHASALTVNVSAGAVTGKHVAVYKNATGHALTIAVDPPGDFSIDVSAYASKTIVIAIYAEYALGTTTVGQIRVYELSPTDEYTIAVEEPELIVLGRVVVPAAGVIPAANFYPEYRTLPSEETGENTGFTKPALSNPALRGQNSVFSPVDQLSNPGWFGGFAIVLPCYLACLSPGTGTSPYGGSGAAFGYFQIAAGAPVALTQAVRQPTDIPLSPASDAKYRIRLGYRYLDAMTTGSANLVLTLADENNAPLPNLTIPVTLPAPSASYVEFDEIVSIKTAAARKITSVALELSGVTFAFAGPFPDSSVFFEVYYLQLYANMGTSGLDLEKDASTGGAASVGLVEFGDYASTSRFSLYATQETLNAVVHPTLRLFEKSGNGTLLDLVGAMLHGLGDADRSYQTPILTWNDSYVGGGSYSLLSEGPISQTVKNRVYSDGSAGLVFTRNARYDAGTGNWIADSTAYSAMMLEYSNASVYAYQQAITTVPWATWDTNSSYGLSPSSASSWYILGTIQRVDPTSIAERVLQFVSTDFAYAWSKYIGTAGSSEMHGADRDISFPTDWILSVATPDLAARLDFGTQSSGNYRSEWRFRKPTSLSGGEAIWRTLVDLKGVLGTGNNDPGGVITLTDGHVNFESTTAFNNDKASNPPTSKVPVKNALYALNTPKVWARISTNGSGGSTLISGFGVASISLTATYIRVTFHNAFSNANFAAVATAFGITPGQLVQAIVATTTYVDIQFFDTATATVLDPQTTALQFSLTCHGEQTS